LNADILAAAEREKVEVFWADKLLGLTPRTLDELRKMGVKTVSYMIDNAFGPRRDPGWRLYMKDIPHFDLHVVQRDKNIADYMGRGARDVIKIQTAYEPTIHFPVVGEWGDAQRDRGVSFIGTSYDDRPAFLTRLWRERGFPVVISGDRMWRERLDPEAARALYTGGELYGKDYREAVWRSKINLSFITHSNQDEFVHKSFEIAACGGFLLAERSAGHEARFVEGEEAAFFTGFEECAEKIARYLPDEAARERIAKAGRERAVRDGYGNDAQVGRIVERLETVTL
jgi:spore maturation protein CgeB